MESRQVMAILAIALQCIYAPGASTYAERSSSNLQYVPYTTRRCSQEGGQAPYEDLVGRTAKVYLDGGQSLEGVFRGSDSHFVVLRQRQGNKSILVNKSRVLYMEFPNPSTAEEP